MTRITKKNETSFPAAFFGPPWARIPLYITVFQSSPTIIWESGRTFAYIRFIYSGNGNRIYRKMVKTRIKIWDFSQNFLCSWKFLPIKVPERRWEQRLWKNRSWISAWLTDFETYRMKLSLNEMPFFYKKFWVRKSMCAFKILNV